MSIRSGSAPSPGCFAATPPGLAPPIRSSPSGSSSSIRLTAKAWPSPHLPACATAGGSPTARWWWSRNRPTQDSPRPPVSWRSSGGPMTIRSWFSSIRAHPARLDRPRPFVDLARHELAEIVGRAFVRRRDRRAEALEPFLHGQRVHRRHGGGVELGDDGSGCAFGQEDRAPGVGLDVGPLLARG